MNGNPKDNEKNNMDRKSYLKEYTSQSKIILSNSEEIIKKNEYDSILWNYSLLFELLWFQTIFTRSQKIIQK